MLLYTCITYTYSDCIIHYTGYCYQFNSNGNMSTTQPGLSGGVTFALSVDTYEYMYGYHSFSEGFSVGNFSLSVRLLTRHEPVKIINNLQLT